MRLCTFNCIVGSKVEHISSDVQSEAWSGRGLIQGHGETHWWHSDPPGKARGPWASPLSCPKHPHERGVPPSSLLPFQPPLTRLLQASPSTPPRPSSLHPRRCLRQTSADSLSAPWGPRHLAAQGSRGHRTPDSGSQQASSGPPTSLRARRDKEPGTVGRPCVISGKFSILSEP